MISDEELNKNVLERNPLLNVDNHKFWKKISKIKSIEELEALVKEYENSKSEDIIFQDQSDKAEDLWEKPISYFRDKYDTKRLEQLLLLHEVYDKQQSIDSIKSEFYDRIERGFLYYHNNIDLVPSRYLFLKNKIDNDAKILEEYRLNLQPPLATDTIKLLLMYKKNYNYFQETLKKLKKDINYFNKIIYDTPHYQKLYYLRVRYKNHYYYKIGITSYSVKKRYTKHVAKNFDIIFEAEVKDAYILEQCILVHYDEYRPYEYEIFPDGWTEIFNRDVLGLDTMSKGRTSE